MIPSCNSKNATKPQIHKDITTEDFIIHGLSKRPAFGCKKQLHLQSECRLNRENEYRTEHRLAPSNDSIRLRPSVC